MVKILTRVGHVSMLSNQTGRQCGAPTDVSMDCTRSSCTSCTLQVATVSMLTTQGFQSVSDYVQQTESQGWFFVLCVSSGSLGTWLNWTTQWWPTPPQDLTPLVFLLLIWVTETQKKRASDSSCHSTTMTSPCKETEPSSGALLKVGNVC